MNALITVGFPKLPYWIRLHVASANSTSQILQSRLGFTGGTRGEADKWAQHPSITHFRQLQDNLVMDKVISDLIEVALFIKDWKIYFHYQVSKWLFLVCVLTVWIWRSSLWWWLHVCCKEYFVFWGLIDCEFVLFLKSVIGCCLSESAFCDTVTILYKGFFTFFTNVFLLCCVSLIFLFIIFLRFFVSCFNVFLISLLLQIFAIWQAQS